MYLFCNGPLGRLGSTWRARVAFSQLLAFIFGFSRSFYSGFKKIHGKILKIFDQKSILKSRSRIFRKISKFSKKSRFSKNLEKFDFFSIQIKLWKISDFSIFRKSWFFRNFRKIFEKFSISISKSIFDQKFSIFFHDFFKTAKGSSRESKRDG